MGSAPLMALALWSCTAPADPFVAPYEFIDESEATRARIVDAVGYRTLSPSVPGVPTGAYIDGDSVWVFSRDSRVQLEFSTSSQSAAEANPRIGPAGTTVCRRGRGVHEDRVLCVGSDEPKGVVAVVGDWRPALPSRSGFRGLAIHPAGPVYVADRARGELWTLDARGQPLDTRSLCVAPLELGWTGGSPSEPEALWAACGGQPRLVMWPVDERGLLVGDPIEHALAAPLRSVAIDDETQWLWAVGPEQRRPTRRSGPLRGIAPSLYGWPLDALHKASPGPPSRVVELSAWGIVDPVALKIDGGTAWIAVAGTDELLRVELGSGRPVRRESSGLTPVDVVITQAGAAVVSRGDRRLWWHASSGATSTSVAAGPAPSSTPEWLGERLFYGDGLWPGPPEELYTCNTCHWDGGTDHRLQPGFEESWWEQTRPLGGVGRLSPLFTTGYSRSLGACVEGLVRGLDAALWESEAGAYWTKRVGVRTPSGSERELSPQEVRVALVAYLASLPVDAPTLRSPGAPLSPSATRGATLFARDCLHCHEARADMHQPGLDATADLGTALIAGPLAFSSPHFYRVGVSRLFDPRGHRPSPLWGLGRGGPYFSDGSAPDLEAVLSRSGPGVPHGHAEAPRTPPAYTRGEVSRLMDFLLSL